MERASPISFSAEIVSFPSSSRLISPLFNGRIPRLFNVSEKALIDAERRSIYTDIAEINKALYMLDQGCTIDEAEADLSDPDFEEDKVIAYKELGRKEKSFKSHYQVK